jgi:hypothetical protein
MAANEDEIADLLKEIAAKHHLSIGRDDPILVLQTINNRLMQNSAKAQQEQFDAFRSEIEAISQRWSQDAKAKADRALSASVTAATEAALMVLQESAASAAAGVRSEISTGCKRIAQVLKGARVVAICNLIAAFLLVAAVVVAVIGFWHRG